MDPFLQLAALLAGSVALFAATAAAAQDDPADDALGFSDSPVAAPVAQVAAPASDTAATRFRLSGRVAVQGALRLERSGAMRFGKLRQVFAPRLEFKHDFSRSAASFYAVASGRGEADLAYLLQPELYDAPTMELYGSQLIPGETYFRLDVPAFEVAIGKQIVNFGQGEVLSLLDVVNPRDLREPLFADLEELRLAALMTRVGFAVSDFRADLIVVHEPSFGLLAPPLGEFSPLRKLLLDNPAVGAAFEGRELRYRHRPGPDPTRVEAAQAHGRIAWSGSRVDLALQAGTLLDAVGVPSLPPAEAFGRKRIDLPSYHPRYALVGHSGAVSAGAFLLRWELASEIDRPQVVRRKGSSLPDWSSERLNDLRALLGVTYVPNARSNLALEALQTLVFDNPGRRRHATHALLFPVEATQVALRASHLFLRERAQVTLVLLWIGVTDFNALAGRAELSYALFDAVRASLGAVSYRPSKQFGPFYGFERNDRIYLNLRWDFAAN